MCPLADINIAIQLNTLQVGYVSICRLLYGSGLIGWWTIIPQPYSHSTEYIGSGILSICRLLNDHSAEYIASGICVHLQIIVWFRFNRLVDNHPTNLLQPFNEYIASGICVHLQIIVWFRFNRLVDNHPTNLLQPFNETLQMGYVSNCRLLNSHSLNTLQVGYVSTCRLLT